MEFEKGKKVKISYSIEELTMGDTHESFALMYRKNTDTRCLLDAKGNFHSWYDVVKNNLEHA